ncbi:transcription factor PAP1-domain-containing protein [Cladorrhinum sp. PSN259]|nr:transcription factor PAP1-domain-containing protein [Cladorrhinum sp. PSN259]
MTSARNQLHDFMLTPQQQNLLFAALNSNRKGTSQASNLSPLQFNGSPLQGSDNMGSFQGSPEFDFDYDIAGADSSFDFPFSDPSQPKMIGDLPGNHSDASKSESAENTESPDKRSHPDDDDDEENPTKRRESEDKVAKKPGRKPLTTEPSSKRKAQNRAAQRAFRERKEKHLKELETKVEELEKASEASKLEKELLRSKIDKMTVELNEYKKRVSALAGTRPSYPAPVRPFGSTFVQNLNDVNFQFEFPKFGQLPGPNSFNTKKASTPTSQRSNSDQLSPMERPKDSVSPSNSSSYSQVGLDSQTRDDIANIASGLFSPPLSTSGHRLNSGSMSLDSHFNTNGGPTTTSSPSASSNSNMGGATSSCGTSPESFTQSPMGFKPVDTLSTIGEEHSGFNNSSQELGHFGNLDPSLDLSWLPQTDFQFDPQLFGDYREPQENVLSQGLDDSFFNDALNVDFITPYNLPITTDASKTKPDILERIDAAKCEDSMSPSGNLLTCNKIWEKLQNCPKVQNGDFDLDGLCSDLQKKAKCSGGGAVVDEADFKNVMKKYLCKDSKDSTEVNETATALQQSNC